MLLSMDEKEWQMVKKQYSTEKAIGVVDYKLTDKQLKGRKFRSLCEDIKAGKLSPKKKCKICPQIWMHPKFFNEILGKKVFIEKR
jgi:pseudaminic acid synthase